MSKRKKMFFRFMGATGVFIALLMAINLLAQKFINSDLLKTRIQSRVSQKIGGSIAFQRINISIFPLPHAAIHEGTLSVPGTASGSIKTLDVYPKILRLFTGKLQFSKIRVISPDIDVVLPQKKVHTPEKEMTGKHILDAAKEQAALLLAPLAADAPDLVLVVDSGGLSLRENNQSVFSFEDIHARIVFPPAGLKVNITCRSNLWSEITLRITLDPEAFKGKGYVNLKNFRPETLKKHLFPDTVRHGAESIDDITVRFETDGYRDVQADVQGSQIVYVYRHPDKQVIIKGKSLKTKVSMDHNETIITLTKLQLDNPRLSLKGELLLDETSRQIRLAVRGEDLDVPSVRETALALAGKIPVTRSIFDIVKGGTIPDITFHSKGMTFADLDNTENFIITGELRGGIIFVPGPDLNLEDVRGDVVIEKGVLKGEDLEARLENAAGQDGTLTIGLAGDDAPFHLDLRVKADLTQLPPLLKRLVRNEAFVNEVARIYDVRGNAEGRLILGDSLKSAKASVDIQTMNLSANYGRIPYPLKINGGQFSYGKSTVGIRNLTGEVGKSSFSGLTAYIDFEKDPHLEIVSGKSRIFLDEIYLWLSSNEKTGDGLKDIKSLTGTVEFSTLKLKGSPFKPETWRFETTGEVRSILIDTTFLPGPVKVTRGQVKADHDVLEFSDTRINMLDASLNASGLITDYLADPRKANLTFHGDTREEFAMWISDLINMPPELYVQTPLSISQSHLIWDRGTGTSLNGSIIFQKGPRASIDLLMNPEGFMINNLLIEDETSRASSSFTLKEKELSLNFTGNITRHTMDNIFMNPLIEKEWIEGDFRLNVKMDAPVKLMAQGRLRGEGLYLPMKLKIPLRIDSFLLNGTGDNIIIDNTVLTSGGNHISLKGSLNSEAEAFIVNLDASADDIDWDTLHSVFASDSEDEEKDSFWDVPVKGEVSLRSDSFTMKRFTWKSLLAEISFTHSTINVAVKDATICNVSSPGILEFAPQGLSLDLQPHAAQKELEPAIACLLGKNRYMTGNFDLNGKISAKGKGESIVDSLHGALEFHAGQGRIYQFGLLSKIFAFLNLTEVFRGRLPDLAKEGFAYKTISAQAGLQGSTLSLKKMIIDGSAMEIAGQGDINFIDEKVNLKILVAPLKTVDFVVQKTPIVKDILGGTFVSIPIRVRGHFKNPKITYMSAADVGSGLLGIMKNTLKAPVKIIQPRSRDEKNGKEEEKKIQDNKKGE